MHSACLQVTTLPNLRPYGSAGEEQLECIFEDPYMEVSSPHDGQAKSF